MVALFFAVAAIVGLFVLEHFAIQRRNKERRERDRLHGR